MEDFDFHKAAGILIRDRKLLVTRERGKEFFIAPGGIVELGETARQALIRELREELGVEVDEGSLEEFGKFTAVAAGHQDKRLEMEVFLVKSWEGEIIPSSGEETIEEIRWINSQNKQGLKIGSIFEHEILPRLKSLSLID